MARRDTDSQNWGGFRPRSGRKPPMVKKTTTSICLPVNILELAQGLAKKREISFSLLVEQALREAIQKLTDSESKAGLR